jgi:hypothetical protein
MTVGSIANLSISAYSTYVNISFSKPANTTKYIVTVTDAVNFYISPFNQTFSFSSSAVGSTVTCKVTGMNAGGAYYVSVTPYNGTVAGTTKQYINSGTQNLVKIPSTTTSSQAGTKSSTSSSTTSTTGNGPITSKSSTGSAANGGTTGPSAAAPANTPVFNAGSVSASAPSDINSSARISQKVEGLNPNTPYSIDIRAVTTDASGNTIYSEWSPKLNLITPGYSTDGNNFQSVNNATDIQLSGGSIFAGTFDVSTGIIDVVNDSVNGSGVILNQTGLLGVNSGTKQFYLDAVHGNAYFAGTIQATIIESAQYDGVTDGSAFSNNGMAINLNNGAITAQQFRIDTSGNAYFNGDVSSAKIDNLTGSQVRALAADAKSSATIAYGAATSAANAATTAQSTADGKNKTTYSNRAPLATDTNKVGDIWWQYSNGIVIGQFSGTGDSSGTYVAGWNSVQIGNLVIANIDAAKINAGIINAQLTINSPIINGGVITGGTFKTSSSTGHIEIGNTSYQDTIIFKNYNGSIGATLAPFVDDSGTDGLIIHSGSNPTSASAGSSDGVAAYWVGRDYFYLQYKANVPLLSTQFNSIRTNNHFGFAYNGQSSFPSYGSSSYGPMMRNIDFGPTGTTTPTDAPPYVGNGDIYLGY